MVRLGYALTWPWLKEVLVNPIHRGPTLNDISPRLAGVKYLTLIDTSLGIPQLKTGYAIIVNNFFLSVG